MLNTCISEHNLWRGVIRKQAGSSKWNGALWPRFELTREGDIAIRRVFSLVAQYYKDRIFKLSRMFCNLHGSVGKYVILALRGTSQQSVAFKFLKKGVFRTNPYLSRFHTQNSFVKFSSECSGTFQRHKRWNIEGRYVLQFQRFKYLSLSMRKRFAWKYDVCN